MPSDGDYKILGLSVAGAVSLGSGDFDLDVKLLGFEAPGKDATDLNLGDIGLDFGAEVLMGMLLGESDPPHASGTTWSTSQPGHEPLVRPVEGQGLTLRKTERADQERRAGEYERARWQW